MASNDPPALRPNDEWFNNQSLPADPPLQGRDLYILALEDQYNRVANAPSVPRWVEKIQRRRNPPANYRDRLFRDQYGKLPSPVRRAWEFESHKRWPRQWETGHLDPEDVYANDDEIYYTRKAGRWSWTEDEIRQWYEDDYNGLPQQSRAVFERTARAINHARNLDEPDVRSNRQMPRQSGQPTLMDLGRAGFDIGRLPLELHPTADWRFGATIGSGSFGVVVVLRKIDESNRTVQRIVVKRDQGNTESEQREFQQLRRLRRLRTGPQRLSCRYLVQSLIEYPWSPANNGAKYLEYAPYGDLYGLIGHYMIYGLVFPEPFVWYFFDALATALLFLETGSEDPNTPKPGWRGIFHTDVKPQNILLDAPEQYDPTAGVHNWHAHYPRPVLADFGGTCLYPLAKSQDQIPLSIQGEGTVGFMPFEMQQNQGNDFRQTDSNRERITGPTRERAGKGEPVRRHAFYKAKLPEDERIRTHTSVYQLGVVVWCMMTAQPTPAGELFGHNLTTQPDRQNPFPAYWDALPRHAPRRPWPFRGASKLDHDRWRVLTRRDWAPRETKTMANAFGGGLFNLKRTGENIPRRLQVLGKRSRTDWEMGPNDIVRWKPYTPLSATRPNFSARLVELAYKCMSPRIEDRPTPAELLMETRRAKADILNQFPDPPKNHESDPLVRPRGVALREDKFPVGWEVL